MAKSSYYIDPVRFTQLLIAYKYTENQAILDRLICCYFFPLARGVLRKFSFRLVDPDDAIQEAVIQCMKQTSRFSPEHPTKHKSSTDCPERKAFSFFTTCSANTFRGLYREEDGQIKKKKKLRGKLLREEIMKNGRSKKKFKDIHDEDFGNVMLTEEEPVIDLTLEELNQMEN